MNEMLLDKPEYLAVPITKLKLVDAIVEKLKGNTTGTVETEKDWDAIVLMFELFKVEYPEHFAWFESQIKLFRETTQHNHAIIKDESGDSVQHMLEMPEGFHNYIHHMFPNQKYDKKFIKKLVYVLPILKVTDTL